MSDSEWERVRTILREDYPSIETFSVDKGYKGTASEHIVSKGKKVILPALEEGKKVSEKRWVVERTFAWMGHV